MKSALLFFVCLPCIAFASPKIVCLGQTDDFGLQIKTTLEDLTSSSVVISYAWVHGAEEAVLVSRANADVSQVGPLFTITGVVKTSAGTSESLPTIEFNSEKYLLISDGGRDAGLETKCNLN